MHDIWNPWHGCTKKSEGRANCFMFAMDKRRGLDGSVVRRAKAGFNYPLQRTRGGGFKVRPGEKIRVCMNSDFFLEEADPWRDEAWSIIHQRPDVKFWLLTKRPERIEKCLPPDWGDGWPNVALSVSTENQRLADERLPILLDIPAAHKGFMAAPLIGAIDASRYLDSGQIEEVLCDGENYDGARPLHFDWVVSLHDQCKSRNITFAFCGIGNAFVKDGKTYHVAKGLQSQMARKSGMSFVGKPIEWDLRDPIGLPIPEEELYVPHFGKRCQTCGMQIICNGCSNCGACG